MLSTFLVQSFIDWICEPICKNIITFDCNIFKICCAFYLYFAVIIIADQIRNDRLHSNLMVSVIVSGRPHADRTACDYYDSSEDIMREIEGTVSRLAGEYEIIMTQII